MGKITCLQDVIDELHLDVYKRCNLEDLKAYENTINRNVYARTNLICNEIANSHPPRTYINQPECVKLFLPPIPELLQELGTSLDEETEGRLWEEEKRKKETLIGFFCGNNLLIALYKDNDAYIFYTYHYDYEELNEVILMSRVEYNWKELNN